MRGFTKRAISERLKILKGNRSLNEFAKELNIPSSTLHYYFNGRTPTISFLLKVCSKLNVREEWLLLGEGPIFKEHESLSNDEDRLNAILKFVKEKWQILSDKERNWFEVQLKRMFPDFPDGLKEI